MKVSTAKFSSPAAPEDMSLALDIYSPLLSPRQREALRLHFEEDLSYGEIATRFKISRQGVHIHVKGGLSKISKIESRLGLISKYRGVRDALESLADGFDRKRDRRTALAIRKIAEKL